MNDLIYDIECYPNIFTCVIYSPSKHNYFVFEVSERKNEFSKLMATIRSLGQKGVRMVGFNNVAFDYPVLHCLLNLYSYNPSADWKTVVKTAAKKTKDIIEAPHFARFSHIIWPNKQVCKQMDLFMIHHFDNVAKQTSLKLLQFNMRSDSIEELPFDPKHPVPVDQFDKLLEYNKHDVQETYRFYLKSMDRIMLREKLSVAYDHDFTNANDTKIGKTIFQLQLEKKFGSEICFIQTPEGRKPKQTKRTTIKIADIIFWYINFTRPEFSAVQDWLCRQVLKGKTKDVFTGLESNELGSLEPHIAKHKVKGKIKNLNCVVDGFQFDFGTGGIHGCIPPATVQSDEKKVIVDLDVTSFYPSLAIKNEVFPHHLGKGFCDIYAALKQQRTSYKKGTPENEALKLALNGVYGDSNNEYSPFYDPQYTMTITVNGQLLICLLSEWLMEIESLKMIQANTDGVTVLLDRADIPELEKICKKWEQYTELQLESAYYKRMFIRDVNNYIAEYEDGKLKRKGAYEYDIEWHQNHSALVIQKAAQAFLVNGEPIEDFIRAHDDPFDFYLRTKVPRSSYLELVFPDRRESLQNITRYFISTDGGSLLKVMPPLPKKPDKWREIGINVGWKVTVHDKLAPLENIDYSFYVKETEKLVNPLITG